jgi:hypothetical protein
VNQLAFHPDFPGADEALGSIPALGQAELHHEDVNPFLGHSSYAP